MTRIIALSSATSGSGKTHIAARLARRLAQCGQRVGVLDAGGGEGICAALGLQAGYTLKDLVLSDVPLKEVLLRTPHGIDVMPGSPDTDWLENLMPPQQQCLGEIPGRLPGCDVLLIDSCTNLSKNALALVLASPEILLVLTPTPSAHTDAYSMLKLLQSRGYAGCVSAVMNRARNHTVGRHSYNKFREVASFYLGMQPPLLGLVREQQAGAADDVTLTPPATEARDIDDLAQQLLASRPVTSAGGTGAFRDRYLRATGHVVPPEPLELGYTVQPAGEEGYDLQQQIADLSEQVDALIATMERPASEPPQPATAEAAADNDLERWLAGLASGSQQVSADGETFTLYHKQRSDNDVIHFVCYSAAHEIETPESGSGSS